LVHSSWDILYRLYCSNPKSKINFYFLFRIYYFWRHVPTNPAVFARYTTYTRTLGRALATWISAKKIGSYFLHKACLCIRFMLLMYIWNLCIAVLKTIILAMVNDAIYFILCWRWISLWFLVSDQLDAQFFSMYLFQFSTCFEQPLAHHQENQLYQYSLWYMSLCAGDRLLCRSEKIGIQDWNKIT